VIGEGTARILEVLPRRNKLARPATGPGAGHSEQVIAANLDQVIPVFSTASPLPKWGLLDRYLVCAEAAEIPALICITKTDLRTDDPDLEAWLQIYQDIGYPLVRVSARTGEGLDKLRAALRDRCSVLVGKSGVGKTTLLNALQPGLGLRVQAVTRGPKGKGRHTTTHLEMFPLAEGGTLVDTPGIREFGLWDLYREELAWCFPEMRPSIGACRFGMDCQHIEEPGCAIREAVVAGQVNPYRYRSYLRLWEELP
jgi:ribosome biogenesis GTPase